MGTSTVPAILANLIGQVTTDAQLGNNGAGITIFEGDAVEPQPAEWLSIGDVTLVEGWGPVGRKSREEVYIVDGEISVRRTGDERADARIRVFALLARVEEILRGNAAQPVLTVVGVWNAELVAGDYHPYLDHSTKAFSATVKWHAQFKARI